MVRTARRSDWPHPWKAIAHVREILFAIALLLIFDGLPPTVVPAAAASAEAALLATTSDVGDRSQADAVAQLPSGSEPTQSARDLLPCPLSVPCRAGSLPVADEPVVVPSLAPPAGIGASLPKPVGGASAKLLPCPQSIPCLAPGAPIDLQDFEDDQEQPARAPQPAASHATTAPARRALTRAPAPTAAVAAGKSRTSARATLNARAPLTSAKREVLMAGAAATEDSARIVLAKAANELTQVDPATLTAENRPTYEEASEFVAQGRAALQAHDNSAALTLGEKARRLVSGLKPATPASGGHAARP